MIGALIQATQKDVAAAFEIKDLRTFSLDSGLPYAIVGHNRRSGVISDTWIGAFEKDAQFRVVLDFICTSFETGSYRYWLADLRYLSRSFHDHQDWLAQVVFPRVVAAGMVREAVVVADVRNVPPDFDVVGAVTSTVDKIPDSRLRTFGDVDRAKRWLLTGTE